MRKAMRAFVDTDGWMSTDEQDDSVLNATLILDHYEISDAVVEEAARAHSEIIGPFDWQSAHEGYKYQARICAREAIRAALAAIRAEARDA